MKNILDDGSYSRRKLLAGLGVGALAIAGASVPGKAHAAVTRALQGLTDGDILNFALNLEYLEAEFYLMAVSGHRLGRGDIGGTGTSGDTTGGAKVAFRNKDLAKIAKEICEDEVAHVRFLRKALAAGAVAKPAINLDALGVGFKSEGEFVALARAFEDVGVSAYKGAARLIENKDYLDAAAGILATEAYHAGNLRAHSIYGPYPSPKLDDKDQPPTGDNAIPTDMNGIVVGRTPEEVGKIVRGASMTGGAFYPVGLNGTIR